MKPWRRNIDLRHRGEDRMIENRPLQIVLTHAVLILVVLSMQKLFVKGLIEQEK